jgi:hypothetical protein
LALGSDPLTFNQHQTRSNIIKSHIFSHALGDPDMDFWEILSALDPLVHCHFAYYSMAIWVFMQHFHPFSDKPKYHIKFVIYLGIMYQLCTHIISDQKSSGPIFSIRMSPFSDKPRYHTVRDISQYSIIFLIFLLYAIKSHWISVGPSNPSV